jgi:hypothetical protein
VSRCHGTTSGASGPHTRFLIPSGRAGTTGVQCKLVLPSSACDGLPYLRITNLDRSKALREVVSVIRRMVISTCVRTLVMMESRSR